MYKLVAFDLDGTLLNTLLDLQTACNRTYKELGIREITYKEMRDNVGYGNRRLFADTYRIIKSEEASEDQLDEMVKLWSKYYNDCYLDKTVEYEGITDLLKYLSAKGVKLAVISNKKDFFTKKIIKKYFNDIEFVDVIGDSDAYPRKPDPSSLLSVISKCGLTPDETLYIGDSENDYKVAHNAGCDSLLVSWGFRDRSFLEGLNPTYLVDSTKEIEKIL